MTQASVRILVVSDIHYAGAAERARRGWESRVIRQPLLRLFARVYRRFLWLADPTAHNHLVDAFLQRSDGAQVVVANGDYSCDSAFVGLSDEAAFASARECLQKLRLRLGDRLLATIGDHELGKMSLFGGVGGPRLASWHRTTDELGLDSVWSRGLGDYVFVGVTSSLLALPVFHPEILQAEWDAWNELREAHLQEIRRLFQEMRKDCRIVLFCHDPTALPFLAKETAVTNRLPQLACTIIGHLHSSTILNVGRCLAGMPELGFLGITARRLSSALRRARAWAPFRIILCPSLAGIQLLKDGGYLELDLPGGPINAVQVRRVRLPWR